MTTADRTIILLVEDDEDNRELMAEVLEAAGYAVLPAAAGADGLRRLGQERIDVVVTDVGMPGVGGLEVARAAKERSPGLPVVLVTGYTDREDIVSAQGRLVDVVLVKPVDPDSLVTAVENVLRGGPAGSR